MLQPWVESDDDAVAGEALKLAGLWQLERFHRDAETTALDGRAGQSLRRAAIAALESYGGERDRLTLASLAAGNLPARIRSTAVAALVALDQTTAARLAAVLLGELQDEAALQEIFSAFVKRAQGAPVLAQALQVTPPSPRAAQIGLQFMSASGRRDENLASVLLARAGLPTRSFRMSEPELAGFVAEVRSRGDARRGAEIFQRPALGCTACHAVNGQGGPIGPDLSALGSAQPIDFIVGAIVDPQKEIKEGYTAVSINTRDGEEYQGNLVRETRDEVVIRDALENAEVRLRRADVTDKRQLGSVMPAGLVDTLTRDEFRDLIRYLSGLGRNP
jgi:putative heme-binding domain-containing protein